MRVVIFGENPNDTRALKALILGFRNDLSGRDVKTLRQPPTLQRGASTTAVDTWASKAKKAVVAAGGMASGTLTVLAHTDADGPDDGSFAARRTTELRRNGLESAHAVVPVEAIESWWLRYPHETESVVSGWRGALRRDAYNTDSVRDPKADLIRRTRSKAARRPYQEADSPAIAAAIATGSAATPTRATSPSFERFRALVLGLAL